MKGIEKEKADEIKERYRNENGLPKKTADDGVSWYANSALHCLIALHSTFFSDFQKITRRYCTRVEVHCPFRH